MVRIRENINSQEKREISQQRELSQTRTETKKVLEEIKKYLKGLGGPWKNCIRKDEEEEKKEKRKEFEIIGTNCLQYWPKLVSCYSSDFQVWEILQDLKKHLERIKNNELPEYNHKSAMVACDYLIIREIEKWED